MTVITSTLPHNLEAERSVLGAILIHNDTWHDVADALDAKDFYRTGHRRIFDRMVALLERGDRVDFVTLKEDLQRRGELDEVGGPAYVASLVDGVPRATNAEYYARIVRELANKRDVIQLANALLQQAYEGDETPGELVAAAERGLLSISERATPSNLKSADELVRDIYPVIEMLHEQRRPVTGVETGLPTLDRFTRGLQPGNLIIMAGRPGQGKTTLATQMALHVARTHPVAFFSLEMNQREVTFRILSTLGKVDGHLLQCGQLSMIDQQEVGAALAEFSNRKFWLDDSARATALYVRSISLQLKARVGALGLVVVDYLQLLRHPKAERNDLAIAETTKILLAAGRLLNVPVLALCQLSRAVEQHVGNRSPRLSDLRDSGSLEQDAHVVLAIHRPPTKDGVVHDVPPTELHLLKQRNGPTATIDLRWIAEQYRFAEIETHHE